MSDMLQIYVHIGPPKTATTTSNAGVSASRRVGISGDPTPRMLNADPTFKVLEAYVQRGGSAVGGKSPRGPTGTGRQALDGQRGKFQPRGVSSVSKWSPTLGDEVGQMGRLAQAMEPPSEASLVSLWLFRASVFSACGIPRAMVRRGRGPVVW